MLQNVCAVDLVVELVEAKRRLSLGLCVELFAGGTGSSRGLPGSYQSPLRVSLRRHRIFSGVARLIPISPPSLLEKRSKSRAPSLHQSYPASAVPRAPPNPGKAVPQGHAAGCDPAPNRASHVAYEPFPTCHSHDPGGPRPVRSVVSYRAHGGLPRYSGGSASTTSLSRPAQDSRVLRPAGSLDRP